MHCSTGGQVVEKRRLISHMEAIINTKKKTHTSTTIKEALGFSLCDYSY